MKKVILTLGLLLAVAAGILSVVNIGGDLILNFAQKALKEQMNLDLTAEGISGNPIRGYTLTNFSIASGGAPILSARSLSGRVSFGALFQGSLRLALEVGGVNMDLDQFIQELQRIKLPESEGGGGDIPIDRVSLVDSRFTSQWGTVEVFDLGLGFSGKKLDVNVDGRVNDIPVKGGGELDITEGVLINRSEVAFGAGKVLATGGIRPDQGGTNVLDIQGSVQDVDLKEITALWPAFLKPQDYDGRASLNLAVSGTAEAPTLEGSLDYRGTRLGGYPVERVGADVKYAADRLTISDIQASALNIPITGEAAVSTHPGQTPSIMLKLEGSEANLDGLEGVFPALKGLRGRVSSFSANVQGPTDALSGTISLAAPQVRYEEWTVANIAAQLKLAKSDTATVNGKFSFEGAQGYLQGTVASLLSGPKLDLTANLVDLDVKRAASLIPDASQYGLAGKLTAALTLKGPASAPSVSGTLSSPSLTGMGQTISKPSLSFAFAKDTLTLQKSSGSLNGMPISVSGTVNPLPSSTPNVNISATITVSPAALKPYVPGIEGYALKGNINAGVKVQGRLPSPSVNLVASSPSLQALGMLTAKNIEVTTALAGDLAKPDKLTVNAKAGSLAASGVTFSDLAARVDKDGDQIRLPSLSAKSGGGSVKGSGTVSLASKAPKLDLSFALDKLALGPLAAASGLDLKGDLTGSLKVSGTTAAPAITFTASAPSVTAQGLALTNLAADVSGTTKSLKINSFKAEVGGAPLTASGTVQITPSLNANVAIRGKALDLAALTKDYPDLKGQVSGKADLAFDLSTTAKATSGKGSVTVPALKAFGLNLSGVNLPLAWSGSTFSSSGGTAKLYSGTAKNTLTYNLSTSKFTDELSASGVDVNALIQDAVGGLGGKITGQGKLSLKLSGSAAKSVSYSGSGQFSMGSGAITGFKWVDLATQLYGTQGIRYASVSAPFTIQTGKLILKSGSIVNANKNDPIYTYAKLPQDGSISFNKALNLVAELNVNAQLLNAIIGGGKGGLAELGSFLTGGGGSVQEGFLQVLGGSVQGAKTGGAEADFRNVTLKIGGKADSPTVALLKLGESSKQAQQGSSQQKSAQQQTQTPAKTDPRALAEQAVDALLSGNKKQNQQQSQAQQQQPQQQQQQQQKSLEDQAKDRLKEELRKGLGGLFGR